MVHRRAPHHLLFMSTALYRNQVRLLLTQFYSVDFSKSRIIDKKCIFNKRTIKVCVSCSWRCPGTSVRHTWQCPCFSVVPEATHEARRGPFKGVMLAQKAFQGRPVFFTINQTELSWKKNWVGGPTCCWDLSTPGQSGSRMWILSARSPPWSGQTFSIGPCNQPLRRSVGFLWCDEWLLSEWASHLWWSLQPFFHQVWSLKLSLNTKQPSQLFTQWSNLGYQGLQVARN